MKQGSAQGKCLGGSCPCKQLFDQLCPRSPHLLHSGSLFCLFASLCLPWHLASQNGPFAQSSWAAMGKLLLRPHHAPLSVEICPILFSSGEASYGGFLHSFSKCPLS